MLHGGKGRGGEIIIIVISEQTHHEQPRKLTADAVCASGAGASRRWPGPPAFASGASALCAVVCCQWPPDPVCHPHKGTAGTVPLAEPSGMNGSQGRPPGVLYSPACMRNDALPHGHGQCGKQTQFCRQAPRECNAMYMWCCIFAHASCKGCALRNCIRVSPSFLRTPQSVTHLSTVCAA